MTKRSPFPRRARSLLLLGICLLILGAVPIRQAQAVIIPQSVDNTLREFTAGTFQRTSLGSQLVSSPPAPLPKVPDAKGGVQLVPLGMLSQWFQSDFDLPEKLTDVGAAAIGTQLFVLGGVTNSARTAHVWTAPIDPSTGAITGSGWGAATALPAVATSTDYATPVAALSRPAVAAVTTDASTNSGFIYVIGGSVRPANAPDTISSYAVNIARVVNGQIVNWSSGPVIPSPDGNPFNQLGAQSAQAVTFTTGGGTTYIYLLGGLQRYIEAQNVREFALKQVFYARFRSDGALVRPSNGQVGWDTATSIPIPDVEGVRGLWDGTAATDHFDDIGGGGGGDVLYITGGQTRPDDLGAEYNNAVYRALINSSNGALTWTSAAGPNQWEGTLPEARIGFTNAMFGGNLYLIGGRPVSGGSPGQPDKAILTSYVEDNLTLAQLGQGNNFFRNNPDPLPRPRTHHGTALVQATPTESEPNAAYVYVLGGQGSTIDDDPTDDQGSSTVTYGKIGGSTRASSTFAPTGWFFSQPHSINFTGAEIQQINWTTLITDASTDIQLQYRTSTANDCSAPNAFDGSTWLDLDGSPGTSAFSVNSGNSVDLGTPPPSRCFQYRAHLTTSNSARTPALLNVSLMVFVPGSPDLKVDSINDIRGPGNALAGLTVSIINHNSAANMPTLPADTESSGSFFVDLFVFGPGQTVITPTVPLSSGDQQRSKAYANVNKNVMQIDTLYTIRNWCDPSGPANVCLPVDLLSLFPSPGTYKLIAVVDSFGYVNETPTNPAEQNNITRKDIAVPSTVRLLFMPMIKK